MSHSTSWYDFLHIIRWIMCIVLWISEMDIHFFILIFWHFHLITTHIFLELLLSFFINWYIIDVDISLVIWLTFSFIFTFIVLLSVLFFLFILSCFLLLYHIEVFVLCFSIIMWNQFFELIIKWAITSTLWK